MNVAVLIFSVGLSTFLAWEYLINANIISQPSSHTHIFQIPEKRLLEMASVFVKQRRDLQSTLVLIFGG